MFDDVFPEPGTKLSVRLILQSNQILAHVESAGEPPRRFRDRTKTTEFIESREQLMALANQVADQCFDDGGAAQETR